MQHSVLLAERVRSLIPADVRKRGEDCFRAQLVYGLKVEEARIGGYVVGNQDYWCEVRIGDNGQIDPHCDCIAFDDHGYCKHLWALARQADDYLKRNPQSLMGIMRRLGTLRPATTVLHGLRFVTPSQPSEPAWKQQLRQITRLLDRVPAPPAQSLVERAIQPPSVVQSMSDRRIAYVIDQPYNAVGQFHLAVRFQRYERGMWKAPKTAADVVSWYDSTDPVDVTMRSHLSAAFGFTTYGSSPPPLRDLRLHPLAFVPVLKPACEAGRCYVRLRSRDHSVLPDDPVLVLRWDADVPFTRRLHVTKEGDEYVISLRTRRGDETLDDALAGDTAGPYVIMQERPPRLVRVDPIYTSALREAAKSLPMRLPAAEATAAIEQLLQLPALPPLSDDSELPFRRLVLKPRPRLRLTTSSAGEILGSVEFAYGDDVIIHAMAPQPVRAVNTPDGRVMVARDMAAEQASLQQVLDAGASRQEQYSPGKVYVRRKALPRLVMTLTAQGWHVEAEGKLYRSAKAFEIKVRSGIDWLEVHGRADYGEGGSVGLPAILEAVRNRSSTVVLDDGTLGILPEEWLKKYAPLAGAANSEATVEGDAARFSQRQSFLLDALLANLPAVDVDEQFRAARTKLARFASVRPADPTPDFAGTLRPYQRQGLGWLQFLHEFGFGGCLADDMGLGKTIQVLALLDWRRATRPADQPHAPSLIVVPRSLVFNWKSEAAKFAPKLRVLDHSVSTRVRDVVDHLREYDVVLTTYGTLRADAATFKDFEFDYVILDEAQAIKNASTASAKAARLLRARHRLAMSGTPIENHLGELWSLFDFLNPGMFGSGGTFKLLASADDAEGRQIIAQTIRPLLLRRTKEQVAKDLPERVEQTIYCDLEPKQRKIYDQLRDHYRTLLTATIEREGIEKSQMQILEALLRLRQAACHPALIDRKYDKHGSAKLDLLMTQIAEAIDEGHKVLVFSQFTSLLAILRQRLDGERIVYEYLDGQTRDRQERVDRFQTDPACKLFLISLKAGGVGLNLTAADYVFLLDPWWNPAVEAQAIDRTHRIGQQRTVIATRLIARDTVEEKVLELQKSKRDLADAIVGEASRISGAITREDLALLLA